MLEIVAPRADLVVWTHRLPTGRHAVIGAVYRAPANVQLQRTPGWRALGRGMSGCYWPNLRMARRSMRGGNGRRRAREMVHMSRVNVLALLMN